MAPNVHSPWITVSMRNKKLEQQQKLNTQQSKPSLIQRTPFKNNTKELRPFQPRVNDPIQLIDAELAKLREAPSKVPRFA
jgi:hypothetical protein